MDDVHNHYRPEEEIRCVFYSLVVRNESVKRKWRDVTLSPFFGQFRGFLKVDRKPASRDHSIHFEALKPFLP